jgi:hypothetical protein
MADHWVTKVSVVCHHPKSTMADRVRFNNALFSNSGVTEYGFSYLRVTSSSDAVASEASSYEVGLFWIDTVSSIESSVGCRRAETWDC